MRAALLAALALAGCVAAPAPAPPEGGPAWTSLAELADVRTEAVAVAAAGKVWAIGGILAGDLVGTRVDVYDPAAGAWSAGPQLPLPLHHVGAVALEGDAILVTGGFVGSVVFQPTAQTWILDAADPAAGWREHVALPEPRGAHAAATDGRTVWVFGGVARPMAPFVVPGQADVALATTAWRLAPGASAWEPMAALPDPRDHLVAVHLDGRVYAMGGRDLTLASNSARVDVYDPANDTWTSAPDLPTARGGHGGAVLAGRIHVVAGEAPDAAMDAHEVFDPATGAWSEAPPLPEPRHGVGVAALDGALYVVAGGPEPSFAYSGSLFRYG